MTARVLAPGKMVLTGAYAVLRGAPALVVAVSRGAIAEAGTSAPPSREVRAALGDGPAPAVDTSALFDGERKLGLGASAAGLVATLGLLAHQRGADVTSPAVRREIFVASRAAHAAAQSGGSGVDVAASVYGGTLAYRIEGDEARVEPCALPAGVSFRAYASATFARTTDLRAKVSSLTARDPMQDARIFGALAEASSEAYGACLVGDAVRFFAAARAFGRALHSLGVAADANIVDAADLHLADIAAEMGGAYFPSGAGGGDVAVHLVPPSVSFDALDEAAVARGKIPLDLTRDPEGVRVVSVSSVASRPSLHEPSAAP